MKHIQFIVWFSDSSYDPQKVEVWALTKEQAVILAQAERIKAGDDYTLHSISF